MNRRIVLLTLLLVACKKEAPAGESAPASSAARSRHQAPPEPPTPMVRDDEPMLSDIAQLTNGGENAEAYFSKDGKELIFQSKRDGLACDQIFRMNTDGSGLRQVSVGEGRTTCSYIQIDGSILYASTHGHGKGCLADPDHSQGYVWPIYPEMDIWRADADGKNAKVLFSSDGYDAEATVCSKDGRVVFTSSKDGDLELYVMDASGENVKRMTNTPGYDGGAFFSADCSMIVWRAGRPEGKELDDFKALLAKNLVRPGKLEIYVMNADGSDQRQLTKLGVASFAPYIHPSNQLVIFSSNAGDPKGRNFDLYTVAIAGGEPVRVTNNPSFDGFPMFSHDGSTLVFASNRNNKNPGETNVFTAKWAGPGPR